MACFSMTYPPSVNRLWRNTSKGTLKSGHYRAWEQLAAWDIASQRVKPVRGPVTVFMACTPPDRRKRDLDNLAKPILDALVGAGVIEGDDNRYVRALHLAWADGPAAGVRITITPIGDGEQDGRPVDEALHV